MFGLCYTFINMKNLFDEIESYISEEPLRMHVPAHKGRGLEDFLKAEFDITELDFSDNLNHPEGIILKEEKKISEVFSSKASLISVNGASAAVICAICSAVEPTQAVLVPDDCHLSVYYGCIQRGAELIRLRVADHIAGIQLEEIKSGVEKARKNGVNLKACVITSPTYFGCCCDIKAICSYLRQENITVIVDEAHGTHFHFCSDYPASAVDSGADYVIHSAHKSINGLTQTGLLHLCSDKTAPERSRAFMRLNTSTSPSYLLMLSVIKAVEDINNRKNTLYEIKKWYNEFYEQCSLSGKFILLNKEKYQNGQAADYDPFKLCIYSGSITSGFFEENFGIYPELSIDGVTLFCCGMNTNRQDITRLKNALKSAESKTAGFSKGDIPKYGFPQTEAALINPGAFYAGKCSTEDVKDSIGRISTDFVFSYPPGAPVIIPGQRITSAIAEYITQNEALCGAANKKIKVAIQ